MPVVPARLGSLGDESRNESIDSREHERSLLTLQILVFWLIAALVKDNCLVTVGGFRCD